MQTATRPHQRLHLTLVDPDLRCLCVDSLPMHHPLHRMECLPHLPRKTSGHRLILKRKRIKTVKRKSQHLRECRLPRASNDGQRTPNAHSLPLSHGPQMHITLPSLSDALPAHIFLPLSHGLQEHMMLPSTPVLPSAICPYDSPSGHFWRPRNTTLVSHSIS